MDKKEVDRLMSLSNEELYDKYEEKFGEIPILHAWGSLYPVNEEEKLRVVEAYLSETPIEDPKPLPKGAVY